MIFDEDTPHEIISALQPDILVKGADWGENAIVGRDVVEARGGKVVRIALAEGYSTTSITRAALEPASTVRRSRVSRSDPEVDCMTTVRE